MKLLTIRDLTLAIGNQPILHGINLDVSAGRIHGLVGESGSGKSLTALSVMKLLPEGAHLGGSITLSGLDVLSASEPAMNRIRGREVAMVFQEPMTALNPLKPIGEQVAEAIRWHMGASRADAEARARAMLDRVGLPQARFALSRLPHELSGGQRQRVVIAIAAALNPKLLIADEATTALDVVLQAQILNLLKELVEERNMGMLLISHDLSVVSKLTDTITIMQNGRVVESGATETLLAAPREAYTQRLIAASSHVPNRLRHTSVPGEEPLLTVESLCVDYPARKSFFRRGQQTFRAVDSVSFTVDRGQSIALVGQSGCGKSSLARAILGLEKISGGTISFDGAWLDLENTSQMRAARRHMQVVFQDPYGSFDPRHRAERLVAEPLHLLDEPLSAEKKRGMVRDALRQVGLEPSDMDKYPHEFSGGQRQRLAIARAIITRPKLVVADEALSALDVSVRARILDLFADLNRELGIAYLFITHDLAVARAISDITMVMHEGRIVEHGPTDTVLSNPQSPAARALVGASPGLNSMLETASVK